MSTIRPGQTFEHCTVQIVIIDGDQAHGWEMTDATANWDFTGVGGSGRSTARITIDGEFRRRTKGLPQ
jgi:hypothetical protein